MKQIKYTLFLLLYPMFAWAQQGQQQIPQESALSFAPPPGDYSVIFLGNIFGVVDGVLHGTGSQILGSMFAVFNAAVLALGGIIIMYTLLVSTLNTAQEGQFLGQKWSSLWVPVRTTAGLALLIPKASGYCLMQIFVMWVIVQGVGAADKVWDAALGYLNRGGAIVIAQPNPAQKYISSDKAVGILKGAQTILAGQVCMLGLQKQLENQRTEYLKQKQKKAGPCFGTLQGNMKRFCGNAVPDFINSVNIISEQTSNPDQESFSVTMPNFDDDLYSNLNGICGTLKWKAFSFQSESAVDQLVGSDDKDTAKMSRAIAIQQMYLDLSMVAQVMVNNDPNLVDKNQNEDTTPYSKVAVQQYGVPKTRGGQICDSSATKNCTGWGAIQGSTGAPLFNGSEFQGAISDYNTIMKPTLTLEKQAKDSDNAKDARKFIKDASSQGWIMAGSYFFNLVRLNMSAMSDSKDTLDTQSGLEQSSFVLLKLTNWAQGCNGSQSSVLCDLFNADKSKTEQVAFLIAGGGDNIPDVSATNFSGTISVASDKKDSTVYGFTKNSIILKMPGQEPGLSGPAWSSLGDIAPPDLSMYKMPDPSFHCWGVKFFSFVCVGKAIAAALWYLFKLVYTALLAMVSEVLDQILWGFLMVPLQGIAVIFQNGVKLITQPGINPIVALANMGTYYINFAGNLWIQLVTMSVAAALIPLLGVFVFALIALTLPLLFAWTGIMVGVGFITAYYIPILPYMIFTFGSIAWLIAVIEAMVAAPIVALGVTHPEGHEAFGKGEPAVMILMNVFLRPSMMVIGYVAAIALSYVGVWVLNAGFENAIGFVEGQGAYAAKTGSYWNQLGDEFKGTWSNWTTGSWDVKGAGQVSGGYTSWAGVYAYFFSILVYTMMYLVIVQKAFTLITVLPDKVLRWIGGTPESVGQEAAQWGEDVKGKVGEGGKDTQGAQAAVDKQLSGYAQKGIGKVKSSIGGSGGGSVTSTPGGGDEGGEGDSKTGTKTPPAPTG